MKPATAAAIYMSASLMALLVLFVSDPGRAAGCGPLLAAENPHVPGDYCWYFDVSATNNTGSDLTDFMARATINTANLIANNQLDPQIWTIYGRQGSYQNGKNVEVQDVSETDSAWWIQMGDIPNGSTRTTRIYMKNARQQRDAGITFTGRESITIPDTTQTDASDNGDGVSFVISVTDDTPRDEVIVDKMGSGNSLGYAVTLEDDGGGGLDIVFYTNASSSSSTISCAVDYDPAWIDERQEFIFVGDLNGFGSSDIWVYTNDGLECSADGTNNPFTSGTTNPLLIGEDANCFCNPTATDLTGAIIHSVSAWEGISHAWSGSPYSDGSRVMFNSFDPDKISESTAVDPTYTGTSDEVYGSAANDATYTFTREQSNVTVSTGVPTLVSAGTGPSIPGELVAVSGNPVDESIFNATENTHLLFYGLVAPVVDDMPIGRQASWALFTLPISLGLGIILAALFRNALSFVVGAGLPYAYAISGGLISEWSLLVWGLSVAGVWGLQKWERQS